MLIKQCHDLLRVTKHLLFRSQRLGFLENVSFGHSSVNFFASILVVTEGLESQDLQYYMPCVSGPLYIYLNKTMIDYSLSVRFRPFSINSFYT